MFGWLPFLNRKSKQTPTRKVLPTGITVERQLENGIEQILVVEHETVEPINWTAVNNIHVIDPIEVSPSEPSFFISEEPVKNTGAWKSK